MEQLEIRVSGIKDKVEKSEKDKKYKENINIT
jgi:hypothetical protein